MWYAGFCEKVKDNQKLTIMIIKANSCSLQALFCLPPKFRPAIDRLDSQFPGSATSPRRLKVHGIAADLPAEANPAFASEFLHHLDRHGGSDWP